MKKLLSSVKLLLLYGNAVEQSKDGTIEFKKVSTAQPSVLNDIFANLFAQGTKLKSPISSGHPWYC